MAAQTVSITWPKYTDSWQSTWKASEFGLMVKNWLIEEGLLMYVDFEWSLNTQDRTVDITFFKDTHLASMVVLKFQG